MPRAALAALLALTLVPAAAGATPMLGPAVSPRGPGRVSIVWESATRAPEAVTLRAPGRPDHTATSYYAGGLQHLEVDGLEPGVEYAYATSRGPARFLSPPDAQQEVHFAVFGDSRTGDDAHRKLIADVVPERPDFYVMTGDVVPDGDDPGAWRTFFDIERPLMNNTPFLTARGNHDGDDARFEQFITLHSDTPGAGPSFGSVDVGPVHFLLLDTERSVEPGSPQYDFARRDLAAHQGRPLIAVLHKPLFSTGRHGGTPEVHDALGPLFQRYGVDLVLQGHDHHYERTVPINGVTYVVTGGAGAPMFGAAGGPWTAVKETTHHYLLVDASATRIAVHAKRLDGSALDSFVIDPRANDAANERGAAATMAAMAAQPLPAPGGGGCAMIFLGRERLERHASAGLGTFGPLLGFACVRGARRRRRGRSPARQ